MTNRLASDEGTDDPEIFRLRMQLTFAETRILELKKELVKEYNRAVDAEERAMHAEEAASSIGSEQLRAIRQQLRQTNEEMQTALSERIHATKLAEQAEQEAQQLRKEVQNMRLANEKLSTELQQRGPTMQPHPYSPVVNQLHTTITARDAKIEQLVDKYDKLTMEHFIVLKQVNKVGEEAEVLLAKNENLTVEIKEVRVRLAAVEKDRDCYKKEYTCQLDKNKSSNSQHQTITSQITSLVPENNRLKNEIKVLHKKVSDLKWSIGYYITDLDLAQARFRVFTCRHGDFSNIPDGQKSTREKTAGLVASEFFKDWENDTEFINEYKDARLAILQHHRAHEKADQGRAHWANNLKVELERVDQMRGVKMIYG